ncbi:ABC transporter ATP-binding protein [Agathobacter ruminis]|uniref:ABC-type quaternary amine transporter n=1 Tax=Agathobacter ruminis TaxID=1712665 RepID=A0A2G3E5G4_9FIRM|nr:ABC transporter ATP-binding protein [Agathobacter ruminis]MDC7302123.1 ABC transporter ATP-binding protein [Agathobacter ruminis]PHU38323.1 ABC transporter ATP-binding protein [Agathobacter ruminis]
MKSSISISNVNRIYKDSDGNRVEALKDVNLEIKPGEFISIIGPSGCGKTTLLRLIAGLDKPQTGQLFIDGAEITGADPSRGYVFQQGSLFPWLSVRNNIAYGLRARNVYKSKKENIENYIELVGLKGFEKSYPHQISGGMAQRVAIARALINEPKALLLDEPMGALDSFTRADLQDKLLELWKKDGTTMVLVTHDIDEAIYLSDRIVIMTPRPGKISKIIDVNLSRPRQRGSASFLDMRRQILEFFELAQAIPQPEYNI